MVISSASTALSASASALHRPAHVMAATASASSPSSSVSKRGGGTQTSLHDFPLPVLKTWGSQRVLRCVKLKGKSPDGGGDPDNVPAAKPEAAAGAEDDGFDRVRAKLMVHLQEAAGKIDLVVPPREAVEEERAPATDVPWRLRTRRGSYCRSASVAPSFHQTGISLRPRSEELGRHRTGTSGRRRKFSLSLSKEEIDEDLYSMTGKRASRRPKKRPRAIRNQLDQIFPGYYLSEVTPDIYEMRELPPAS